MKKNSKQNVRTDSSAKDSQQVSSSEFDKLAREAEQEQKRKPGSQSNSSKQHNNGRGGGK